MQHQLEGVTLQRLSLRWYQRLWLRCHRRLCRANDLVTHSLTADLPARPSTAMDQERFERGVSRPSPSDPYHAYTLAVWAHVGQRTASTAQRQFDPVVFGLPLVSVATRPSMKTTTTLPWSMGGDGDQGKINEFPPDAKRACHTL